MKQKIFVSVIVICILFALLLSASVKPPVKFTPVPVPVQTEPAVSLDDIRTAELSDVPKDAVYYDTACYMLYNKLMGMKQTPFADSNGNTFAPFDIATLSDAVLALNIELPQEKISGAETTPLTRATLAMMLYDAAKELGFPTETSLVSLPYPDADTVSETHKEALLWVMDKELFKTFTKLRILPNTAVSRLQLAQAIISFKALDPANTLAIEICSAFDAPKYQCLAIDNHTAIQSTIDSVAAKYGAVGVQVAVIENGTVTDTFEYGWATKNTDKMTVHHKIRTASITKVAIGTGVQLLRENGIIGLDEDISDYWGFPVLNPHFPDDPITIRYILTHTSSIVNAALSTRRDFDYVKSVLQEDGFSPNKPGNINKWSYNNYAFAVLGMTLELASEKTLNEFFSEKLFTPMDMDASFTPGDIKNRSLLATVYNSNGNVGLSLEKALSMKGHTVPGATGTAYSGGLTASAYDLAKFFALIANDGMYEGMRLLESESIEIMETCSDKTVRGGFYQAMPLRFKTNLYGRDGVFFHTGSSYGV